MPCNSRLGCIVKQLILLPPTVRNLPSCHNLISLMCVTQVRKGGSSMAGTRHGRRHSSGACPSNISTLMCETCSKGHNEDQIVLCDECDRGYHFTCVFPHLEERPDGEWYCDNCVVEREDQRASGEPEEGDKYKTVEQFEALARQIESDEGLPAKVRLIAATIPTGGI